ncbi:MAG: DUF1295 domain-containing protein [Dehalococcoidales bacterium]
MEIYTGIWISAVAVWLYMTLMFVLAVRFRDNSIADSAWGIGFITVALVTLIITGDFIARQILVTSLVLIWGLRLAVRIFIRNWGKGEDYRYQQWRQQWGRHFLIRSYLQVFMLQGLMLLFIVYPVVIINTRGGDELTWLDFLGAVIWAMGFMFESVGDYQLDRFVNSPANRGKIMDRGLWHYSRHPNYFGEVTQWWGIFFIALSVPWGWTGIVGPLTITLLIVKVSGIPLLEKKMAENPAFVEYQKRTSALIPWFPRKPHTLKKEA